MPTPWSSMRPLSQAGRLNLLRLVAEEIIGDRHRHQDEADGEQHLIERACAVEPPIERALERDAEDRRNEKGRGQGREEGHAGAVHHQRRHVAADHREGAVGEVDEIHQPQRHRQSARQHEQQHAVGHAVEQDGQHGARALFDLRPSGPCHSREKRESRLPPRPWPSLGARFRGRDKEMAHQCFAAL